MREAVNLIDLSLGAVMAGTGDITCMQRFRVRHGMLGSHLRYGSHMTTHMAMGFLYLGGGRYTLGTSNAAVACLVAALYPRFPLQAGETRGLLQAFRHLWVLAVEPRCLIARDADTNEIARIPIKVKISEGEHSRTHHFVCPTLLPDFNNFVSLKVDSPRYWPFVLDLSKHPRNKDALLRSQTIFVKRRTGFLAYANDPSGFESIHVWHGAPVGEPSRLDFPESLEGEKSARSLEDLRHLTTQSTNDKRLIAFADRFCRIPGKDRRETALFAYCQQALLECLTGDKPQTLQSLLALYQTHQPPSSNPSTIEPHAGLSPSLQDLIFANNFYKHMFVNYGGLVDHAQRQPLVRVASLQAAVYAMTSRIGEMRRDLALMAAYKAYARGEPIWTETNSTLEGGESEASDRIRRLLKRRLAFFLLHERAPGPQTLAALRQLCVKYTRSGSAGIVPASLPTKEKPARIASGEISRMSLALILQMTVSAPSDRGPTWSLQSINEILDFWGY